MNKIGYLTESAKHFTKEQAILEASRCILCEDAPCSKGCPINSDPRLIIELVKNKEIDKAVEMLREKNAIAAICARVCPYDIHCVGECRKTELSEPIMIPYIEKFLMDYENDNIDIKLNKLNSNNKKVAIIGSGPSGLSAAAFLSRNGYDVTVFDEREDVGGWLSYGIPPHRLPKSTIKQDVDYIKSLGVKFINNCKVGRDTTIEKLREEGFEAFLLCTGFNKGRILKVKGHEFNGVYDAVSFLAEAKSKDGNINVGKSAIVIGGGDVAMDCGTTAKLTGYDKVRLIVRGSLEGMTASEKELKYLQYVKVPVIDNFDSYEIIGDENGNVCAMEFVGLDDSSKLRLEADTIIFAVGQYPDGIRDIAPVELDAKGSVVEHNFKTSIEDIFATGDIIQGEKTACYATALGKRVAKIIDEYLIEKENSKVGNFTV